MARSKARKTESSTSPVINGKVLKALVLEINMKKTRVQSISDEIGERIKAAAETGHLHRGAFGLLAKMSKMQDELKRDEYIRNIRLYLDMGEELGLLGEKHVGNLVDDAEAAQPDLDEEASASNVTALKGFIKPLDPLKAAHDLGYQARLHNHGGVIPDTYTDRPDEGRAWLAGWGEAADKIEARTASAEVGESGEEVSALPASAPEPDREADADVAAEPAAKPKRGRRKADASNTLGDAPANYALTH